MLKLYFGNIPTILSTVTIIGFGLFFKDVITKDVNLVDWKKVALLLLLLGFIMSAMGGAKDYSGGEPAIEFVPTNMIMIALSVLGVLAILLGVVSLFVRNESFYRFTFYGLSSIIIIKVLIVEFTRIIKHFSI